MKRPLAALCAVLLSSLLVVLVNPSPASAAPAWPVLRQGSAGSDVSAVQHLLTARGYGTTVDGSFGPGTKSKVVAFQSSRGLAADGVVGANTWSKLVTTVRQGDSSSYVRAAQTLLNKYGYRLAVDGVFGPGTRSAAASFQSAKGITSDGIIGPVTWQYLAGSGGGNTNPPATNCGSVTSSVPISHTTVITSPNGASWRVHTCLAGNLDRMFDAAAAAGHNFTGSGWRDPNQQIALRRQNCGTSYYAIYQMPASQCTPPTAIPGTSRHERGLAVDLSTGLSTSAFNWLKANASRYGLYNLPSERWHWSTDGH